MATHGVSAAEASAALVAAERSRARVAWTGYPAWYWLGMAAVLAVLPLATLLPAWVGLVTTAVVAVLGAALALSAGRVRGVCEGWTLGAMRLRDVVILYGPAVVVSLAGSFGAKLAWWVPVTAAVLAFGLLAGTGLTMSARAARR